MHLSFFLYRHALGALPGFEPTAQCAAFRVRKKGECRQLSSALKAGFLACMGVPEQQRAWGCGPCAGLGHIRLGRCGKQHGEGPALALSLAERMRHRRVYNCALPGLGTLAALLLVYA